MTQYLNLFMILLYVWNITADNYNMCTEDNIHMDVVILTDTSCPMTPSQCANQQQRIAKTLLELKGPDNDRGIPTVRAAYIEYGSTNNIDVVVPLNQWPYNSAAGKGGITNETMMEYFSLIQQRCDHMTSQRESDPDLKGAIFAALKQFDTKSSDDLRKDKKIVIFSNCPVSDIESICYFAARKADDVDFFMVNIGDAISNAEAYIMCLVEYDPARVWTDISVDDDVFYNDIIDGIQYEVCTNPTPTPTADPTSYPNCYDESMDLVILVDTATPMSYVECREQQERVAYAMIQFKGIHDNTEVPNVRVSVIEVGSDDVYVRVAMNQYPYNRDSGPSSEDERMELYDLISRSGECYADREEEMLSRKGNTNLYDALICALNQFDSDSRDKNILIFSNSMANNTEKVCQFYTENKDGDFSNVDIFMYDRYSVLQKELECLVNDVRKMLNNPSRDNRIYSQQILPTLKELMCSV